MAATAAAVASFVGGERRNRAQEEMSSAQMAFQREMSNTAHQRQVADLKAAGINPMLSAKLGGASTPMGSQAILQDTISPAVQQFNQTRLASAQEAQYEAQTGLTDTQAKQVEAATDKIREEIKNIPTEGERLRQMVFVLQEQEYLYRAQGFESQERQRMLAETVKKLIEETKVVAAEASAISSLNNLGREFGQLKPLIDTIIGVMKGLK